MQNFRTLLAFVGLIVLCAYYFPTTTIAQNEFIITLAGDTISGHLRDQRVDLLCKGVSFRAKDEKQHRVYRPVELRSFRFSDGDTFESHHVEYVLKDRKQKEYPQERQVFLRRIVQGEMNLYTLPDQPGVYFVKKSGEVIVTLCEEEFVSQLTQLMADCIEVNVPTNLRYRYRDLVAQVLTYNKFMSPAAYQEDQEKSRRTVGRVTAFASLPMAYHQDYGGIGRGAAVEMGGKQWGLGFSFEHVVGRRKTGEAAYKMTSFTLRTSYRLPVQSQRLSPYTFAGWSVITLPLNVDHKVFPFDQRINHRLELGAGLDWHLSEQCYLRAELAYPHFPNVRIGVGWLLR